MTYFLKLSGWHGTFFFRSEKEELCVSGRAAILGLLSLLNGAMLQEAFFMNERERERESGGCELVLHLVDAHCHVLTVLIVDNMCFEQARLTVIDRLEPKAERGIDRKSVV